MAWSGFPIIGWIRAGRRSPLAWRRQRLDTSREHRNAVVHPRPSAQERSMRIGVPRDTKTPEGRVALVPAAAGDLVKRGHEVWLEAGAGTSSGFSDEQYARLGVNIAADAAALYGKGELIVKVKEPIDGDL